MSKLFPAILRPEIYQDTLEANQFGNSVLFPYRRLGKIVTTNCQVKILWKVGNYFWLVPAEKFKDILKESVIDGFGGQR